MKLSYYKHTTVLITALALATAACGQSSKVKTITIINGDTTINESTEMVDKEIRQIEKEISIIRDSDSKTENKTIVKKIIVNNDDSKSGDAVAYAYSMNEDDDTEVITNDDGKETKIIIRKEKDDKNTSGEKRKVVKRSDDRAENKENISLNINIKDKTVNLGIETNSKEPLYISVLDENGKQFFYDSKKDGGKYNKDLKLEKGTYFLNIIQNKKTTNEKIVIN
ncbi:MAG: hypothetical protein K0Q95_397 [Bacteroidota bacterium]|jgi:hypothetical protein|nr:hypothetical protein [Bacteroidota bacterium]